MYTHVTESLSSEPSAARWLRLGAIVFPNVEKDVQDYWGFTMIPLRYVLYTYMCISHTAEDTDNCRTQYISCYLSYPP